MKFRNQLPVVCCVGMSLVLTAGCGDDDDDVGGNHGGRGGVAGAAQVGGEGGDAVSHAGGSISVSGTGGSSNGGTLAEGGSQPGGELGGAGGSTSGGDAGGAAGTSLGGVGGAEGDDRAAFRPEERAFDQTAFENLSLPAGFSINVYRGGLGQARMLAVHGPHVYVTQPMQGNVIRLVDANDDGVAEAQSVVASDLPLVHGIAFSGNDVYLANVHSVFHATVNADGDFSAPVAIINDLPDGGQHALRTLAIGPDNLLYISVGSDCDACNEPNPEHATILRSTLAGQAAGMRTTVARGLRNTIGFGWHPVTQAWWGMDQGSDWRGNNLPPEELNAIMAGKNYGWPYCYGERVVDPIIQDPPGQTKAAYCATTEPPVLLNQAHQSPIGFAFYTGTAFPERYRNGAFVAFHGSWNRKPATGYRVAFVPFVNGQPQGIEDFVDGFLSDDGTWTFGRPAGVTVADDGSLLFSDDTNGVVYRVSHD
jgi:glucose/arabinose dehydrogenase